MGYKYPKVTLHFNSIDDVKEALNKASDMASVYFYGSDYKLCSSPEEYLLIEYAEAVRMENDEGLQGYAKDEQKKLQEIITAIMQNKVSIDTVLNERYDEKFIAIRVFRDSYFVYCDSRYFRRKLIEINGEMRNEQKRI